MTVATLFWLVYVAAAIGWQVRHAERGMQPLTGTLALAGVALAYGAAAHLYRSADRGWILLADATVLTVAGAMLFSRRAGRDLSSLLWASGAAWQRSGSRSCCLVRPSHWFGPRRRRCWPGCPVGPREPRLLLASAGYLMLAFVHVLTVDSPPADLFVSGQVATSGLVALMFVVCAALVFAICVRAPGSVPPGEPHGVYQYLARTLVRARPLARSCAVWSGASAALYGACLAVVALSTLLISDDRVAFERGHAGATALISAVALAAFVAASGRTRRQLAVGALIMLAAAAVKVVTLDLGELPDHLLGISLVAVGASSVLMGFVQQRSVDHRERANPLAMLLVGLSVALLCASRDHHRRRELARNQPERGVSGRACLGVRAARRSRI
jgi:hypothetical protein